MLKANLYDLVLDV